MHAHLVPCALTLTCESTLGRAAEQSGMPGTLSLTLLDKEDKGCVYA